jgi:dihydrofolate reductase
MAGANPASDQTIGVIAAVARNGVIGRDNGLVFSDPADQRHFRQATMGCPVIMGRKTWDSLPERYRPLPGRRNVVLSHNPALQLPGAERVASLSEALALVSNAPRVWVIGGAQLYAQALPLAHTLLLTEVDADLNGDTYFPPFDHSHFVETQRESHTRADGLAFSFVRYARVLKS